MAAELERSVETVLAATVRAEELSSIAEVERQQHRQANDAARRAARAVLVLAGEP
jgi:hypothetical protein